eukprot:CAMPEP_0174238172 /NCGR_PEP_ID=MMETSP0417-20130205/10387_1 /TAXON_ID=242541 /ORGANISM="Mayorella sp, Strain BSH-02190019" /LENGTH=742 /DNA_ID=CAMNT_0015316989 /DNA_START=1 /DNA_END=2229 /DNA_ORIENTATION=-
MAATSSIDLRRSATIMSAKELARSGSEIAASGSRARVRKIFDMFDTDRNETLDIQEFQELAFAVGETLTNEQTKEVVNKLDENGDGVISFDEFYHWWTNAEEGTAQKDSTDAVLKLRLQSSVLMRSVTNILKRAEEDALKMKKEIAAGSEGPVSMAKLAVNFRDSKFSGEVKSSIDLKLKIVPETTRTVELFFGVQDGVADLDLGELIGCARTLMEMGLPVQPKFEIVTEDNRRFLKISAVPPPVPNPAHQFLGILDLSKETTIFSALLAVDHDLKHFDSEDEMPHANLDIALYIPKQSAESVVPLLPLPDPQQAENLSTAITAFRQAKLEIVYSLLPVLFKAVHRKTEITPSSELVHLQLTEKLTQAVMMSNMLSQMDDNPGKAGAVKAGRALYEHLRTKLTELSHVLVQDGNFQVSLSLKRIVDFSILPSLDSLNVPAAGDSEASAASPPEMDESSNEFTLAHTRLDTPSPLTDWTLYRENESGDTVLVHFISRADPQFASVGAGIQLQSALSQDGTESVHKVRNVVMVSDGVYVVCEAPEGAVDLFELITKGELSESDARKIAKALVVLIQDVHFRGYAHRDIKPENILVTPDKKIMLSGWRTASKLPFTEPCGTPPFMAPEVFTAAEYDNKCDVWSIGVLAYVMVAQKLPFARATLEETLQAVAEDELDLSEQAFSQPLKDFLRRTLTKNPKQRDEAIQVVWHLWLDQLELRAVSANRERSEHGSKLIVRLIILLFVI